MHEPERIPAGWYPDPLGTTHARWWDSYSWTEHTSDSHGPATASETILITPSSVFAEPEEPEVAAPKLADAAGVMVKAAPPLEPQISTPVVAAVSSASTGETATAAPAAPAVEPDKRQTSGSANGWLAVNFAINTVGRHSLIRATSGQIPELIIDVGRGLYWCDVALETLPRIVGSLTVKMRPRSKARTPPHAGQDIRPLLWMLGVEIESGGPIASVNSRNRFKLRRIPTIASIKPSSEQMQMASTLTNAYMTPGELAAATKSSLSSAIRLIAFFSFIGLVSELPEDVA